MEDTIVAISTNPAGESGIGIVRISGTDATVIAGKIFTAKLRWVEKDEDKLHLIFR